MRYLIALFLSFVACTNGAESSPSAQCLLNTYDDQKIYKNVAWLTTHNAFVNFKDGWRYAQQNMDIDEQFAYGVRSFMIDIHKYAPAGGAAYLALCHNACDKVKFPTGITSLSPPTPVLGFFTKIASLLTNNPRDIITLHFESYTGLGGWQQLQPLLAQSGLSSYLGVINPNDPNLTLGSMRQSGKRLVIFSDNLQDDHASLPYRIFYTGHYRETQYSLLDYNQCERRFDNRDKTNTTSLLVMNHFHTLSYKGATKDYNLVNSYNDIIRRANLCHKQEGIYPNFVAVDFVEKGDWGGAKEAVLAINTASVPASASVITPNDKEGLYPYVTLGGVALGICVCALPPKFRSPILSGVALGTGISHGALSIFGGYLPEKFEFLVSSSSQFFTHWIIRHYALCGPLNKEIVPSFTGSEEGHPLLKEKNKRYTI